MAPCNGTTSTPPTPPTITHYNGTPSTPPKLAVTLSSPRIAHYNCTLQWHPAMALRSLNHSTLAIASSNGTTSTPPKLAVTLPSPNQQWHPTMAPRPLHPAMAPWCHVQCAKVWFVALPPIESKNPYSYRYLGKYVKGTLDLLIALTQLTPDKHFPIVGYSRQRQQQETLSGAKHWSTQSNRYIWVPI